jgi:hypothetical protein
MHLKQKVQNCVILRNFVLQLFSSKMLNSDSIDDKALTATIAEQVKYESK